MWFSVSKILNRLKNNKLSMIMIFAVIGSSLVIYSRAQSNDISLEIEKGQLCGVAIVNDAQASSGKTVEFGKTTKATQSCISGKTYYVDCSIGNDTATGLEPNLAWKTLVKASSAVLAPGDGILLKRGCTFDGSLTLSQNGSAAKPIVISAYGTDVNNPIITRNSNGADIIVRGTYNHIQNVELKATAPNTDKSGGMCSGKPIGNIQGVAFESGASNNELKYSSASGLYAAVYVKTGATNNKIKNNIFTNNNMMSPLDTAADNDAGAFGILLWGDDNEIAYNQINDNNTCSYDYGHDGSAIEVYNGSRNKIHHNTANNDDAFIELGKNSTSSSADNIIAYNLYTSNLDHGVFLNTRGVGNSFGPIYRTSAYNNTVYMTGPLPATGQGPQGVVCSNCGTDILILKNNILWATWKNIYASTTFNESNNIYWNSAGNPTVQGFTMSSTSYKANPLFISEGTNFRISANSPAHDKGSVESVAAGYTYDLDNKTVPNGNLPDIGAYEFLSGTVTPPPPPPTTGSVNIAAVGDMNPSGNTSASSPSGKNAAAIISGLNNGSLDYFFGLGDFQYTSGTCTTLVNEWGRLWSALIPKTYTIAGPTHDVASATDEMGHRLFFNGECPGSTAKSAAVQQLGRSIGPLDFYSFDIPNSNWHVAALPTGLWRYDTAKAAQVTAKLDADLAAAKASNKNLLALYHDPYFTSATSNHTRETKVKPWVDVIDKYDVRLTLSGSQHNYERSCPILANDSCVADNGTGTTAFNVSTGGISLRSFSDSPSYIVKRFSDTHGWLKLTLNSDGSFSWIFNPVQGTSTDSGSRVKIGG